MITIEVIGMNHYMLADYSKENTKKIAELYKVSSDEIFFHSGDLRLYHEGVDQTSWHTLMRVHAPSKFLPFEKKIADFLILSMTDYILNAHVEFVYFDETHTYHHLNNEYASFFPKDEEEYEEEDYEEDEDFSDEELFEGNAFENFEERLKEKNETKGEIKMCECGHQHVCCEHQSPGCGKICLCGERCNHHHEKCECGHCHK